MSREAFQVKYPQKIISKAKEKYFWVFQNMTIYASNRKIVYMTQAIVTP